MQTVVLRPQLHQWQKVIAIEFPKHRDIALAVKKLKGSPPFGESEGGLTHTYKAWYLPLNRENFQQIAGTVKRLARLDYSRLKNYLEKRKRVAAAQSQPVSDGRLAIQKPAVFTRPPNGICT